jgi:hypothetical protein
MSCTEGLRTCDKSLYANDLGLFAGKKKIETGRSSVVNFATGGSQIGCRSDGNITRTMTTYVVDAIVPLNGSLRPTDFPLRP